MKYTQHETPYLPLDQPQSPLRLLLRGPRKNACQVDYDILKFVDSVGRVSLHFNYTDLEFRTKMEGENALRVKSTFLAKGSPKSELISESSAMLTEMRRNRFV